MALHDYGLRPFQVFDYTPVGLAVTLAGVAYMALVGRRLLPARELPPKSLGLDLADLRRFYNLQERLFVVRVPHDSSLAGKTLVESRLGAALGLNVIGILRNSQTLLSPGSGEVVRAGEGGGDVDMYAEVFVGRACAGNTTEAARFVDKTIWYLSSQHSCTENVLLVGEYLGFGGIAEWGGNYLDELIGGSGEHGYTKRYNTLIESKLD